MIQHMVKAKRKRKRKTVNCSWGHCCHCLDALRPDTTESHEQMKKKEQYQSTNNTSLSVTIVSNE
jgi:hypothetical protein